jgi:acetyl esterase/lipase
MLMVWMTGAHELAGLSGSAALIVGAVLIAGLSSVGAAHNEQAVASTPTKTVAAARASTDIRVDRDLTYETTNCAGRGLEAEKADLYLPAARPLGHPTPLVILIHGGSFVKGSRLVDDFPRVASELATLGWAAASIDYCLPPMGVAGYPDEVNEAESAVGYFESRASEYQLDPHRFVLWGASAGATLAVDSTTLLDRANSLPVVAAVGWSGAYQLGAATDVRAPIQSIVSNYLGCAATVPSCRATYDQASAVTHVTRYSPPMYLANSTDELMPLDQLVAMHRALAADGVRTQTQIIPGTLHAMAYTDTAFCPTVAFLATYLGPTNTACIVPPAVANAVGASKLHAHSSRKGTGRV